MTSNSVADAVQSSPDIIPVGKPKGWKPKGFNQDDSQLTADAKNLNGRYCGHFFNRAEISAYGGVFMCCPFWLPVVIGDLNVQTMEEIWNGEKAQEVRNQLWDGRNWPMCKHNTCPKIHNDELVIIDEIPQRRFSDNSEDSAYYNLTEYEVNAISTKSTVAEYLPHDIQVGTEESCNLYCPSCRNEKILHAKGNAYNKRKRLTDKLFDEIMAAPKDYWFDLWITGGGDPFGSKIFRERLQDMDLTDRPNTWLNFQTNGVMLTPKTWDSIHRVQRNIKSMIFSFDAGRKDTYEKETRLGGHWDQLVSNVDYVYSQMGDFKNYVSNNQDLNITHNFVVQTCNYKEIPEFIQMVKDRWWSNKKPCRATFSLILQWGHMLDFEQRAIWKPTHPEHKDFLRVLQDPRVTDNSSMCNFGNMGTLVKQANA